MNDLQVISNKILELLSEAEIYQQQKETFISELETLFKRYQRGEFTYFAYTKERDKILKEKTREEVVNAYNAYIYSLLKKIETLNEQLFYKIYTDTSYKDLAPSPAVSFKFPEVVKIEQPKPKSELKKEISETVAEHVKPLALRKREHHVVKVTPRAAIRPIKEKKEIVSRLKAIEEEKARIQRVIKEHKEKDEREKAGARARELEIPAAAGPRVKVEELLKAPKTPEAFGEMKKKGLFEKIKGFFARKAEKAAKTEKAESKERLEPISAKAPVKERAKAVKTAMEEKAREKGKRKEAKAKKGGIKAPKKNMFDRFVETAKPGPMAKYKKGVPAAIAKKGEEGVSFGKFFGWDIFKIIKERTRPSEAIGKKTELSESTILMETERRRKEATVDVKQQIEKITATALTEEAKRIRSILEKRKALRIYQPTFFGALANVMTKRISLFLLDHFPDFFKGLYQQLRLANIKILSNTYVNMMVFSVIFSMILGFVGFGLAFSFLGLPWVVVVVRTLFMAFIMGILMFAVFYAYPSSKAKTRRMSINTNMPFAVNHMAAVASSGVPPTKMFKLISESEEYKEIAVECEKIVNYIEIFGYDVLTAIKSVAVTTPSPAFKEFFNGMVSTTQSGGDVKSYLAQKADEAMLAYRLERKKYTETIATYSDIYTGILIAAPLFFVAALSLVSMLGGTVGGTNVNTIIVVGTYLVIPLLNVAFIAFLKFTQPEV